MKYATMTAAACLFLSATSGLPDTLIKFKTNAPGSPDSMSIKGSKVLISAPEGKGRFIMDTAAGKITMINDQEKKYFELDNKTVEQTSSMMKMMQNAMLAQLKNLPPEQRKAIESRLGLQQKTPPAPKVEIKPTSAVIKVNGIPCTMTNIFTDGKKTAEACVATTKAAGISEADFATMQKMFRMSRELAEKAASMSGAAAGKFARSLAPDLDGFPMEVRDLRNGNNVIVSKIEKTYLSDTSFKPGRGYQKFNPIQEMQKLMQRPN
ncbi:MAG TPA: hypothetical protein ENJ35_09160 [Gammaproteobacteria bacterium]|nr:hypothetical protein [Gammaproteobacteria bacterium]